MASLTSYVRSLGNAGALENARSSLDDRARDEWLVAILARCLEQRDQQRPEPSSPTAAA